jgi:hypothetical protein
MARKCCYTEYDSDHELWCNKWLQENFGKSDHSSSCTYPVDVTEDGALGTSVGLPQSYFDSGQTIIKPEPDWATDRTRYRVRHDTLSIDRTFENETRPL